MYLISLELAPLPAAVMALAAGLLEVPVLAAGVSVRALALPALALPLGPAPPSLALLSLAPVDPNPKGHRAAVLLDGPVPVSHLPSKAANGGLTQGWSVIY